MISTYSRQFCKVHRVRGDHCFVLKALVPSPADLATMVDALGRFGPVTTSVVLKSEPPRILEEPLMGATRAAE